MDKQTQGNTKIECNIHIPKNNQNVLITKPFIPNLHLNLPFLASSPVSTQCLHLVLPFFSNLLKPHPFLH